MDLPLEYLALSSIVADIDRQGESELTASEKVLRTLRRAILDGIFKNGQMITEVALALGTGFSRTPVREALKALEAEGLITRHLNKGWRVHGITKDDVRELFRLRESCEELVVEDIVGKLTDEQQAELLMNLKLTKLAVENKDLKRIQQYMADFNNLIIKAAGSHHIKYVLEHIYDYINHFSQLSLRNPSRAATSYQEHLAIAQSIIAGDLEGAKTLVRKHVEGAWQSVEGAINNGTQMDRVSSGQP